MYRFGEWPNAQIPRVVPGVYTVYGSHREFLYVGMAGAELTKERIEEKLTNGKQSGLYDRLSSHASGYRSGDRFNIYIADLYVLPTLTQKQITGIAKNEISFDSLIKKYIREKLSYRFLITECSVVRELESHIQKNGINGELPLINSRANQRLK